MCLEKKLSTQSTDITFNHIFRHLLELTQLNEDPDTLIQLFNEQGLTIDVQRIEAWTKDFSLDSSLILMFSNNRAIPLLRESHFPVT